MATTGRPSIDPATREALFEGFNVTQLAHAFRMDRVKLQKKIARCLPDGERGGSPIYLLHKVAPYLVVPILSKEDWLKAASRHDLPHDLRKEYWAGARSRQLYEIAAGDLWHTDKVIEHISDLLKAMSMSMKLIPDTIHRETGLDPQQREMVVRLTDAVLADLHHRVSTLIAERELQRKNAQSTQDSQLPAPNLDEDDEL